MHAFRRFYLEAKHWIKSAEIWRIANCEWVNAIGVRNKYLLSRLSANHSMLFKYDCKEINNTECTRCLLGARWRHVVERFPATLQWHHNEHDGVSNHQLNVCLFNRLFKRISKKTSKLRVTCLCEGNSPTSSLTSPWWGNLSMTDAFRSPSASEVELCGFLCWKHERSSCRWLLTSWYLCDGTLIS